MDNNLSKMTLEGESFVITIFYLILLGLILMARKKLCDKKVRGDQPLYLAQLKLTLSVNLLQSQEPETNYIGEIVVWILKIKHYSLVCCKLVPYHKDVTYVWCGWLGWNNLWIFWVEMFSNSHSVWFIHLFQMISLRDGILTKGKVQKVLSTCCIALGLMNYDALYQVKSMDSRGQRKVCGCETILND